MNGSKLLFCTGKTHTRHGEPVQYQEGLYQVSPSCYAWMVPNGSWGETNIGLIECQGKTALVDTCWDLPFTREMLKGAESIVQRSPIDLVINTHSDGDHCWGNQLFQGREIIATHTCAQQMHHMNPHSLSALKLSFKVLKHIPFQSVDTFSHYMADMLRPYHCQRSPDYRSHPTFQWRALRDAERSRTAVVRSGPGPH